MDSTFTALPAYAELFCFSNFTFLHGASHAEELVARATQLGYAGLAITDECSLAGIVRAHVAAQEAKLPLVIGSYFQLRNADGSPAFGLILLAQNREGYGNLSELITLARMRAPKGEYRLTPHDLSRPIGKTLTWVACRTVLRFWCRHFRPKKTRWKRKSNGWAKPFPGAHGSGSYCISVQWTISIAARWSMWRTVRTCPSSHSVTW
jgi:DNA polymerase III alpha subunit